MTYRMVSAHTVVLICEVMVMDDLNILLTPEEAYAVAEFIDMNIFTVIRNDEDWDSFYALRNLIHAYEKCCEISHFKGLTDQ